VWGYWCGKLGGVSLADGASFPVFSCPPSNIVRCSIDDHGSSEDLAVNQISRYDSLTFDDCMLCFLASYEGG